MKRNKFKELARASCALCGMAMLHTGEAAAESGARSAFEGSVPTGAVSAGPIALKLNDAIERGLKTNLGVLERERTGETARARRMAALSALLPNVSASIGEVAAQTNLKSLGLDFPVPGFRSIVGPFQYTDARAFASVTVFDYSKLNNFRSAKEGLRAARLSIEDARDLVVQAVASAYLQIVAEGARVESARAQVSTAQALFARAADQKAAGTSPGIDVLRAQVEWKTQQQRLVARENSLAKDKLALGRAIGLPNGQEFTLADDVPFAPLGPLTAEEAIRAAYGQRPDYLSAKSRVLAAELAVKAATAKRYPTVGVEGNYGDIGPTLANSHGTFQLSAAVKMTLFDGGRNSAEVMASRAALLQRKDEVADLGGRIDAEVRTVFLDLKAAAELVAVAQSNRELAARTLDQAKDRFAAGVTGNIEVVQAQESVAAANESLISALFAHNLAKVSLAKALGMTARGIGKFIEVK